MPRTPAFDLETFVRGLDPATLAELLIELAGEHPLVKQRLLRLHLANDPKRLAERMNWSKQGLSKALTSGRVFYADVNGERYYPAFFFEDRYGRRQVQTVSKALGTLPGATKLLYMQTPKASLAGMTPLEALAKGRVGQARAAAEAFAQG